ncbi:hypothetical protein DFH29DRAFT_1003120 [Suillus ampliporus]|nr:hypothetical protein DFH29DRAFT_1003120 [Suillus ampliporus]
MSQVVPYDGVYRIQNVAYWEQNIGLRFHDIIVVGRHKDSPDPRIEWNIKATSIGDNSKIIIESASGSRYIGADAEKVVYTDKPYEWNVSYRDVGRWIIRDTASGLLMFLPNGDNGTEVQLTRDGAGDKSYWRFIPLRAPTN